LTSLAWFATAEILDNNEQRSVNAAYNDAWRVAESEYEAAGHSWWVDRVSEIVGVDLLPFAPTEPQPRFEPFSKMCIEVEHELTATTADGSRSLTAVWLGNPNGLFMTTCVRASRLSTDVLSEFIAARGASILVDEVRDDGYGWLLLILTSEPATGGPLATEAQIKAVADLTLTAERVDVFNAVVLCDAPDVPVVILQDNGQPPYQDCPPGRGGRNGPIILLPDMKPPQIDFLPPEARVVTAHSPFRFSGVTEPDATVDAGGVAAEVAPSGEFEVWVPLTEGGQVVTFRAVDTAGNSTVVSREVEFDPSLLALQADGIGVTTFGQEASVVVDLLTELLGPPSQVEEESTASNPLPFGYGARNLVRVVGWDEVGLRVVFADGDHFRTDGMLHLVAWYVREGARARLSTPTGISVDSSLDELKRQHPVEFWIAPDFEECTGGWPVRIGDGPTSDVIHLIYELDPSTPGARPVLLHAGAGSTC
jgi:hypothetical protein